MAMSAPIQEKPKHNFKNLMGTKGTQSYLSKFDAAVKNLELLSEEEKLLKMKAIQARLLGYF